MSATIEMGELEAESPQNHLPAGWRWERRSVQCSVLGSLASVLTAESSSKQRVSNEMLPALSSFQQKMQI